MECWSCQKVIELDHKPGRQEECPHCFAPLHVCLNCRFYDEFAHNQCKEPQAERVPEKDRANFCDYFESASAGASTPRYHTKADAQKKWDELFKKK